MREACEVISAFAYDIIDKRMSGLDEEKKVGRDLLDLYLESKSVPPSNLLFNGHSQLPLIRDENGAPISRSGLRDAVINILIAGRECVVPPWVLPQCQVTNMSHFFQYYRSSLVLDLLSFAQRRP